MLVVFASEHDDEARRLVRRWKDDGAVLMVPSDLSSAGWCILSSQPSRSTCVINGALYRAAEIKGVLVRWPAVVPADLPHIPELDRTYVAAEMNAFLVYWLTALGCPILNRPTPRSLCGPGWDAEHWTHYASQSGLRTRVLERSVNLADAREPASPFRGKHDDTACEVTIVGAEVLGDASPGLRAKVRALVAVAGVSLATVRFDGGDDDACFLEADVRPRLDDPAVEAAVVAFLKGGASPVAIRVHAEGTPA